MTARTAPQSALSIRSIRSKTNLSTPAMNTAAINARNYARHMMAVFTGVIVLSIFLYGTFLLIAVERTASRTVTESQIRTLQSELGGYQAQYLSLTRSLTPQYASAHGFTAQTPSTIVYADTVSHVLSLNNAKR